MVGSPHFDVMGRKKGEIIESHESQLEVRSPIIIIIINIVP